jgi:leucyl aminopeptidase
MNITVSKSQVGSIPAEACIFFFFEEDEAFASLSSPALRKLLREWSKRSGWKARRNSVEILPSEKAAAAEFVVVAGLGNRKDFHPGRLEQAAASAVRTGRKINLTQFAVSTSTLASKQTGLSSADALRLILRGLGTGAYDFKKFKSGSTAKKEKPLSILLAQEDLPAPELKRIAAECSAVVETMAEVRDLANTPANEAYPEAIAEKVRGLARKYGVTCNVMDEAALRRKGCHALLAVGRGSRRPPCLIQLKYAGRSKQPPVALVGKTITFDTGGISLKPGKGMEWMKFDKCGGMAVLAAILIAARLKLSQPVVAFMAVAENMPDGNATRPGDIVKSRAGKTIEILNTDAEGRLILCDALSLAVDLKPKAIVDVATLTGACIIALGHAASGLMSNHPQLAEQLQQAGAATGDRVWPLPIWQEFEDDIQGQFADLKNIGDGSAGTIIGGIFLKQFVPADIPWAHIDVAGTAYLEGAKRYGSPGATLAGTRLLVEWLSHAEQQPLKRDA